MAAQSPGLKAILDRCEARRSISVRDAGPGDRPLSERGHPAMGIDTHAVRVDMATVLGDMS